MARPRRIAAVSRPVADVRPGLRPPGRGEPLRVLAAADWSRLGGFERTVHAAVAAIGGGEVQAAADALSAARLAAAWRADALVIDGDLAGAAGIPAALAEVLPRAASVIVTDDRGLAAAGALVQPRPLVARRLAPVLDRIRRGGAGGRRAA